jgi:hypothetical protein
MTGARTTGRFYNRSVFICAVALILAALLAHSPASAVVVISDGFGDADLDNNGIGLEMNDVDISGAGDGAIGPYVALGNGGTPMVFPMDTMVSEVTAIEDAGDVGIKWFSVGQWVATTMGAPDPRASVHVIDDTAAALPETNPSIGFYHAARSATSYAEAIDDGLALAVESKGRGQTAAGFFGQTIELGDEVGDEVKVSFDFRIWYSAPNFNSSANNHVPVIGDFRFGIYQDTDNQLGTDSQKAGPNATASVNDPRTWGEEHGYFRGDNLLFEPSPVGANGDKGWFVRVPIDDPNTILFNQAFTTIARINEETNEGTTGDNPRLMTGTTDHVSEPPDNAGPTPYPTNGIDINKVYNFSLSLKRYDDPATLGDAGDTIFAQFTITERSSGLQWTWGDYDAVGVAGGGDPDGGFESDSWDYFAMQLAGQSTSDDFDWLIDSFTVELFGSNAPEGLLGDFNDDDKVDAADYVVWRKNETANNPLPNDDGLTTQADRFNLWRANFGEMTMPGGGSGAIPEPASALLLVIGGLLASASRRRDVAGTNGKPN